MGLITYMRTDSLRLSDEAVAAARSFAGARYGQEYLPDAPRHFKAKAGAQDAHEAIRPSNVALTPESIKKDLTAEQFRLYKLIWSRFLACQMANAIYDSVNIEVTSADYVFKASRSEVKFPGFLAVYEEGKDEEGGEIQSRLPNLQEGEPLVKTAERPEQKFTQPPTRYTEATLIRALEEKGIGRPSTYAPTITTIMNREYVVKDGKYLHTTPLGEVVTGLMKDKFKDIVDYAFTADMEGRLDKVENGEENWKKVLGDFYQDFRQETGAGREGPGRHPHQGSRRGLRRGLRRVRAADGGEVRAVWPLPGLPWLPGLYVYEALGHRDARQVPQVRQPHLEEDLPERLHLLRL